MKWNSDFFAHQCPVHHLTLPMVAAAAVVPILGLRLGCLSGLQILSPSRAAGLEGICARPSQVGICFVLLLFACKLIFIFFFRSRVLLAIPSALKEFIFPGGHFHRAVGAGGAEIWFEVSQPRQAPLHSPSHLSGLLTTVPKRSSPFSCVPTALVHPVTQDVLPARLSVPFTWDFPALKPKMFP